MRRLQKKTPARDSLDALDSTSVLFLMIWSGLLIYWANSVYRMAFGRFTYFSSSPIVFFNFLGVGHRLADGMLCIFFFMWFFAIQGLVLRAVTPSSPANGGHLCQITSPFRSDPGKCFTNLH